ncbi:MAG: hypothetical protein IKT67_10840 [Lachnospiraceae bacterium]|nr:hypothetical protein [Lachnospiraceae bacterium]
MRINVLKKGDRVMSVMPEMIVVERKNGEVDIIPLLIDGRNVRIDYENITTIGYGNNVVEIQNEDGFKVTNF